MVPWLTFSDICNGVVVVLIFYIIAYIAKAERLRMEIITNAENVLCYNCDDLVYWNYLLTLLWNNHLPVLYKVLQQNVMPTVKTASLKHKVQVELVGFECGQLDQVLKNIKHVCQKEYYKDSGILMKTTIKSDLFLENLQFNVVFCCKYMGKKFNIALQKPVLCGKIQVTLVFDHDVIYPKPSCLSVKFLDTPSLSFDLICLEKFNFMKLSPIKNKLTTIVQNVLNQYVVDPRHINIPLTEECKNGSYCIKKHHKHCNCHLPPRVLESKFWSLLMDDLMDLFKSLTLDFEFPTFDFSFGGPEPDAASVHLLVHNSEEIRNKVAYKVIEDTIEDITKLGKAIGGGIIKVGEVATDGMLVVGKGVEVLADAVIVAPVELIYKGFASLFSPKKKKVLLTH